MKSFLIVCVMCVSCTGFLSGCGEKKPTLVADPDAYAPYQAPDDAVKAQMEEMKKKSGPPKY